MKSEETMQSALKDYYKILGLNKKSDQETIKKAYRKLARQYHPDLNQGDKSAEDKFKEINEAYEVLSDPRKKAEYENGGASFYTTGEGFENVSNKKTGSNNDFSFFGDIFSDIFSSSSSKTENPKQTRPINNIHRKVELTLEEAYTGVTKSMKINVESQCASCAGKGGLIGQRCSNCAGTGRSNASKGIFKSPSACAQCSGTGIEIKRDCKTCLGTGITKKTETIKVRIPAGIDTGARITLKGKGASSNTEGNVNGDIIIEIDVKEHNFYKRKGADLYITVPVTFTEAALGAKVEVPTLDGIAVMTLAESTQGGTVFKLKSKGMVNRKNGQKGDLYVEIKISVPKYLSAEDKAKLRQLDKLYFKKTDKE
ncbi:molecular chaperone DnaJ [Candidatus Magnetoovum chiemensis]|nr:molecular chaperone DnaJ [Candidatus Magnetoovum chiemensis]